MSCEGENKMCFVCEENISSMSSVARELHLNNCLNLQEKQNERLHDFEIKKALIATKDDSSVFSAYDPKVSKKRPSQILQTNSHHHSLSIEADKFLCMMCNRDLSRSKLDTRIRHLKDCGQLHKVDMQTLAEIIAPFKHFPCSSLDDQPSSPRLTASRATATSIRSLESEVAQTRLSLIPDKKSSTTNLSESNTRGDMRASIQPQSNLVKEIAASLLQSEPNIKQNKQDPDIFSLLMKRTGHVGKGATPKDHKKIHRKKLNSNSMAAAAGGVCNALGCFLEVINKEISASPSISSINSSQEIALSLRQQLTSIDTVLNAMVDLDVKRAELVQQLQALYATSESCIELVSDQRKESFTIAGDREIKVGDEHYKEISWQGSSKVRAISEHKCTALWHLAGGRPSASTLQCKFVKRLMANLEALESEHIADNEPDKRQPSLSSVCLPGPLTLPTLLATFRDSSPMTAAISSCLNGVIMSEDVLPPGPSVAAPIMEVAGEKQVLSLKSDEKGLEFSLSHQLWPKAKEPKLRVQVGCPDTVSELAGLCEPDASRSVLCTAPFSESSYARDRCDGSDRRFAPLRMSPSNLSVEGASGHESAAIELALCSSAPEETPLAFQPGEGLVTNSEGLKRNKKKRCVGRGLLASETRIVNNEGGMSIFGGEGNEVGKIENGKAAWEGYDIGHAVVQGKPDFASMATPELKKMMSTYGLKAKGKRIMRQKLEHIWTRIEHTDNVADSTPAISSNKYTQEEQVEQQICDLLFRYDELYLQIVLFQTLDIDRFEELIGYAGIKCSKPVLRAVLDRHGVIFAEKKLSGSMRSRSLKKSKCSSI